MALTTRQVFPDRLRGLALLGIVLVNAPYLGVSSEGYTSASLAGAPNTVTAFLVIVLAQGKFYLLFSFLFGYSATLILKRGEAPDRRRFRRRLGVLAAFGALHAVLFFIGDILVIYAILGVGLLAISRRSNAVVRGCALVAVAGAAVVGVSIALLALLEPSEFASAQDPALLSLDASLAEGTFWEAAAARLTVWPAVALALFILQGPLAFAAFCVGLLAGRSQLLADPQARASLWPRLAIVGIGVGLPLQVIAGLAEIRGLLEADFPQAAVGVFLGFLTAPVLAAGYVGLLALVVIKWPRAGRIADAPGRMSLTVYISESIVLSMLFSGYGLGFFGAWGAAGVTMAAFLTWLILAAASWLWLRRFRQGPLEFIVGKVTGPPSRVVEDAHPS